MLCREIKWRHVRSCYVGFGSKIVEKSQRSVRDLRADIKRNLNSKHNTEFWKHDSMKRMDLSMQQCLKLGLLKGKSQSENMEDITS